MTLHFVANEEMLVYWERGFLTGFFGLLAGGASRLTTQVHLTALDELRFATHEDFERFNISSKYHLPEKPHDPNAPFQIW